MRSNVLWIFYFLILAESASASTVHELEQKWGISVPLVKGFKLMREGDASVAGLKTTEVELSSKRGRHFARLTVTEGLSAVGARNLMEDRVGRVMELYTRKFRGNFVFDRKPCQPKKEKILIGGVNQTLLEGLAGKDREFGVCDSKAASHRALLLLVSCPNRKLVLELKYFFPLNEPLRSVKQALSEMECAELAP